MLDKLLEKDRNLRCQSATELKTDLNRLKRDLDSGQKRAAEVTESRSGAAKQGPKSLAVLYFENLSGVKEDEYLRDGITEDIITELSKIRGLNTFSRPTVLAFRDKQVTPQQIGQQLHAAYVLTGSLRRAGSRLRINTQLVDTQTDFPMWSERYDREMKDVFEVQDEIARKIAEALRVTLSPQELEALAVKPTENLQAYDLYLRGKRYARRQTRQDLEFALQMFENAVTIDPSFALAYAACANACAMFYSNYGRDTVWVERAREASGKAVALRWDLPEVQVSQAWVLCANGRCTMKPCDACSRPSNASGIARERTICLCRALFSAGRYQEVVDVDGRRAGSERRRLQRLRADHERSAALGKDEALKNIRAAAHRGAGESSEARYPRMRGRAFCWAGDYAELGRMEDADARDRTWP